MAIDPAALYQEQFVERQFERLDLFQQLAEAYGVTSALYPGSFVHVTPSFVFPYTTYVDTDRRTRQFFDDPRSRTLIAARRQYAQPADVTFLAADYRQPLPLPQHSFDLLISQYAGFVSHYCRPYLKVGGLLLANNSHGDAGLAAINEEFVLTAVVQRRRGVHRLSTKNLDAYFVPNRDTPVTKEFLLGQTRGIGYTQTAVAYLFRRTA